MPSDSSTLQSRRRLSALRDYALLDTAPEEGFDRLAHLAVLALGVPTVIVGLVDQDREFVKSCTGLGEPWASRRELPLTHSVAGAVVEQGEPLVLDDVGGSSGPHAGLEELGAAASLAVPLATPDGHVVGALSVLSPVPRSWTGREVQILAGIASAVMAQAELHRESLRRTRAEEALHGMEMFDELTGLYNQKGLLTLAKQQLKLARRVSTDVLLVFADVDALREINREYGEGVGDRALLAVAQILRESFRESDLIARLGEDEFAVLAMEGSHPGDEILAERLLRNVADHNAREDAEVPVSISLGIARFNPDQPCSVLELVIRAGTDMASRKRSRQDA